ncbi:hypothetical protein HII31_12743 [Pseudocercospora fuligena]|uniref:Uncharacterized protein n=1 Tax=Pseudocercospora fuligena TaxID=685502 RepID=A0A8H6VGB6_9PEZI|nr:hypothetical protein HII31_12743 [Pseudocercospora fuligena]
MTHLCDAIKLDVFSNEIAADIQSKQQQFESNEWYLTCGSEQLNIVRESTIPVLVRKRESYEQHVGQRLSDHARLWAEENDLEKFAALIKSQKASIMRQVYDSAGHFFTSLSSDEDSDDYEEHRTFFLYRKIQLRALFRQRLQEQEIDYKNSSDIYLNRHRTPASESHKIPSLSQLKWKRTRLETARRTYEVAVKEMLEHTIAPILGDQTFPIYRLTTENVGKIPDTIPSSTTTSSTNSLSMISGRDSPDRLVSNASQQATKVQNSRKLLESKEQNLNHLRDEYSAQLSLYLAASPEGNLGDFEKMWREQNRGFDEQEEEMLLEIEETREEYLQERSRLREQIDAEQIRSDLEFEDRTSDGFDGISADHEMRRMAEVYTPFAGIRKWQRGVAREVDGYVEPSECEEEMDLDEVDFEEGISNGNGSDGDEESRVRKQRWIPERALMERNSSKEEG